MTSGSLAPPMDYSQLVQKCTGAHIKIPFLHELSPDWKPKVNHQYDDIVEKCVENWRKSWLKDSSRYKRNVEANCAFMARTATPDATQSKMGIFALFTTWLFAWDDAVDFGDFDQGYRQRELLYMETLNIIRKSLLDKYAIEDPARIAPNVLLAQSFYMIGVQVRESTKLMHLKRFFCDTLCDYLTAVEKLQNCFEEGVLFSIDEYLAMRMNSSAIYPTIALSLISQDVDIPEWLLDHALARGMMRHINVMILLDNDIVSARNEVKCKHAENMISLLIYHQRMSPQQAVDHCCYLIRSSYIAFQKLEPKLLEIGAENDIIDEVQAFLRCCKNQRIGLVNWLYTIKRYFDFRPSEGKTHIEVVLGE